MASSMMTRKIKWMLYWVVGFMSLNWCGCTPAKQINIGIYDWETQAIWTPERKEYLSACKIKKLYIKCLETDGNEFIYTQINGSLPTAMVIVPVIRLNSDYFLQCKEPMATQASRLFQEIVKFQHRYQLQAISEIQVDFDYTAKNREIYFSLLKSLKLVSKDKISITMNLEKLKEKQYLPPVDGAMLMLYDFGGDALGVPAIFDEGRLFSYQEALKNYPMPLRFAVATFSRTTLVRNHEAITTLQIDATMLRDDARVVFSGNNRYEVISSFDMAGVRLQQGDILVGDEANKATIEKSVQFIKTATQQENIEIVFFSLSNKMMQKFAASGWLHALSGLK